MDEGRWIAGILNSLGAPQSSLVRELLEELRALNESQSDSDLHQYAPERALRPLIKKGEDHTDYDLLRKRKVVYERIRSEWQKVKHLPTCLKQCQLLKETAFFSIPVGRDLFYDPLVEKDHEPITLDSALIYIQKARTIAEQFGDKVELIEIYYAHIHYYIHKTNYEQAREINGKMIELAREIGSLHYLERSYASLEHLYTLTKATLADRIEARQNQIAIYQQMGDIEQGLRLSCFLVRLLIMASENEQAKNLLYSIDQEASRLPLNEREEQTIRREYYNALALLHISNNNPNEAISAQRKGIAAHLAGPSPIEEYLLCELALLEELYLQQDSPQKFAQFCDQMRAAYPDAVRLKRWYHTPDTPDAVDWDPQNYFDEIESCWQWVDPLSKSHCQLTTSGLVINPIMGTGFYSNVYAPRLMLEKTGDFIFETTVDLSDDPLVAGGILVYQEDATLIRFGTGIQANGEITLTAKSYEMGFLQYSRGLCASSQIAMRIARRGDEFCAWCSDGDQWWCCGSIEFPTKQTLQVGIYAECSYRIFAATRCNDTPVKFTRVQIGK